MQRLASPFGESAEGNGGMLAVSRAMLNSPMLSIFQNFHAIPLRSPLISLRSKWRLTGFSHRFTLLKIQFACTTPSGRSPMGSQERSAA